MPSRKQEKQIRDVMTLRQLAMSAILAESARDMSILTANEALSKLQRDRYAVATAEGVTEKIYQNYVKDLNRGGTSCIERVVKDIGDGKVKVTTSRTFVPWLNDMTKRESAEIITLLGDAERNGLYPYATARELKDYFKGTNHNAMTAARTEAAKIRNDARSQSFIDSGVKYVEYVTAGDELVRPEHAMRNGKIYRHEDAPWIGEYNCRCLLVPADYKVEEKGAEVTPDDAEVLDKEALMAREPTQAKTPSPDAEPAPAERAQSDYGGDAMTAAEVAELVNNTSNFKELNKVMSTIFDGTILSKAITRKCGFDVVKKEVGQMSRLVEDVPAVRNIFDAQVVETVSKDAVMAVSPTGTGPKVTLKFNPKFINNLYDEFLRVTGRLVETNAERHGHPLGASLTRDSMTHESGHGLLHYALWEKYGGDMMKIYYNEWLPISETDQLLGLYSFRTNTFSAQLVRTSFEAVRDKYGKDSTLIQAVEDLSRYATTNVNECVAEAYSDYYANFEKAKPLSIEIVTRLNKMINTGDYTL